MGQDGPFLDSVFLPSSPAQALSMLAEPISTWFRNAFKAPTTAQRFAWPALARGDNLLLSAPTGTGKTLAAFLPIISQLWDNPANGLFCLYIAPLKALGRDVGKNLRRYLRQIEQSFQRGAASRSRFPGPIRVSLRTGDTPSCARRRQLERPPHVLLTTPESLAILLTNPKACDLLGELRWVVVDEIHALAGNKRGADLALSLERLDALRKRNDHLNTGGKLPGFQRVGLSATCAPIQVVARFLVGADRLCTIAQVPEQSPLDLTIEPLPAADADLSFMARLVARLEAEIAASRTTLIFTNIRSLAERVTWALKRRFPQNQQRIAVHHSSLAADSRQRVERRLKKGRLDVVVTSTSLELGIDIGNVDSVVLIHPPGGVARFLQRLGRSGHSPGQTRRGLWLTSGTAELLEATVTAAASLSMQLEPLLPPSHPLDVLCQHLAGMAMAGWWTPDEAFALICRAYPYRFLSRSDFDACLDYLSGRHADGRPWLPARLQWQQNRFAIINQRTLRLLRRNLGTILNEEPRPVRLLLPEQAFGASSTARPKSRAGDPASIMIGFLDDAYADRLRPGDRLLLDGRCFQYRRRENGNVLVDEVSTRPVVPNWSGSGWSLSRELARRLYLFRLQAAEALREGPDILRRWLTLDYGLGSAACAELARMLVLQEMISEIPDSHTLLVESVAHDLGRTYYFHTPLHRPGNDALARLAAWRLFDRRGVVGQTMAADLGFSLDLPLRQPIEARTWSELLGVRRFDDELDRALGDCASLRERFAQVATVGLMVMRNPLGGRRKVGGRDWAQRRLFDQVREAAPDFVLLRQAEKEMRAEICDAEAAHHYLTQLSMGQMRCRHLSQISPFAASWTQAGEPFTQPEEALASLHAELVGLAI